MINSIVFPIYRTLAVDVKQSLLCRIFGDTVVCDNLREKSNLFLMSDVLFAEFQSRGLEFHEPLADTSDGLRAFELKDYEGYVLCFGKPF